MNRRDIINGRIITSTSSSQQSSPKRKGLLERIDPAIIESCAAKMRRFMDKYDLSAAQVAEVLGFTEANIYNYTTGKGAIRIPEAIALCQAVGADIMELIPNKMDQIPDDYPMVVAMMNNGIELEAAKRIILDEMNRVKQSPRLESKTE